MKNKVSDTGDDFDEEKFTFHQKKKLRAERRLLPDGVESGWSSSDPDDENASEDESLQDVEPLFAGIQKITTGQAETHKSDNARARADRAAREIERDNWRWNSQYGDLLPWIACQLSEFSTIRLVIRLDGAENVHVLSRPDTDQAHEIVLRRTSNRGTEHYYRESPGDTPGDGDCFYHAFLHKIRGRSPGYGEIADLKAKIAGHIRNHRDEVGARLYDEHPRPQSGNGKLKSREIFLSKDVFDIDKILSRHADQRAVRDSAAGSRLKAGNLPSAQSFDKTDTHAEIPRERDADVNNQAIRASSPDSSASTLPSILRKEPWRRGRHKKTVAFNDVIALTDENALETKSRISKRNEYDTRDRIIALTRQIAMEKKTAGYEQCEEQLNFLQKIVNWARDIRYAGTGLSSNERPNEALKALHALKAERDAMEAGYRHSMLVGMMRQIDFSIEAQKNALDHARAALQALEQKKPLDEVRPLSIAVLRKFAEIELQTELQIMSDLLELHAVGQFFTNLAEKNEEAGEAQDASLASMYALIANQLKQMPAEPMIESAIKSRFDADAEKIVREIIQQLEERLDSITKRWEEIATYASQMDALPAEHGIDATIFLIRMLAAFFPNLNVHQQAIASAFSAYREDVETEKQWRADLPLYLKQKEIETLREKIDRLSQLSSDMEFAKSALPPEIFSEIAPGDMVFPSLSPSPACSAADVDTPMPASEAILPLNATTASAAPESNRNLNDAGHTEERAASNPSNRFSAQTELVGAGTVLFFFGAIGLSLYAVGLGSYTLAGKLTDYLFPEDWKKQAYEGSQPDINGETAQPGIENTRVSTESAGIATAIRSEPPLSENTKDIDEERSKQDFQSSPRPEESHPYDMPQGDQPAGRQPDQPAVQSDAAQTRRAAIRPYADTGRTLLVTTNHIFMTEPGDLLLVDEMPGFRKIIVDSSPLAEGEATQYIEILPLLAEEGFTVDIGAVVFRKDLRVERNVNISKAGEEDVTFVVRGDERTVARQITWIKMVARHMTSLGTDQRMEIYGILRGRAGVRPDLNMSVPTILLDDDGNELTIYHKPDFLTLTVNLKNLAATRWQRKDRRKVILFELLMAGFRVESFSDFFYQDKAYTRTATLYRKESGYFIIAVRGVKADVDRIIGDMIIENKKYGLPPQDRDEEEDKPEPDGQDINHQCDAVSDRLLEETVTSNAVTVIRTPPSNECDIHIPQYASAPGGKIVFHIYHNTVNFPDFPRGRFEIIFERPLLNGGKQAVINIPYVGNLKMATKQINENGTGSITYTNDESEEDLFQITVTNKNQHNKEVLHAIGHAISESNMSGFKTYMSYTGPFMEEAFDSNPSVNGTYKIDSRERQVTIRSHNAIDEFELVTIENDVTLVVGAYAPKHSTLPFSRPQPDRRWIVGASKKPLMFYRPWLREDPASGEAGSANYQRNFRARDNGAKLMLSARDALSTDAVDDLAEKIILSMQETEAEFESWMVRLSIGDAAFPDAQSITEFNRMTGGLPGWAYNRAISFYRDKAGDRNQFSEQENTHGIWHARFDIVRSALVLLRDAGNPGWTGVIDWESTPIPKQSDNDADTLFRSKYVPGRHDRTVPTDWNWRARTRDNISSREPVVEYAIENWMSAVNARALMRQSISRYYESLAHNIKDANAGDARKILVLLNMLNTRFPDGADVRQEIDRSKRIFTEFDLAMKRGRLEQAPVRERLLISLQDLLPKFDVPGPVNPKRKPTEHGTTPLPPLADMKTGDDLTTEIKKYVSGDPSFGRFAMGGRFGFNVIALGLRIPAWWAFETTAGEIDGPIDRTTYTISDEYYAGVVIVKAPSKDAAFIFPQWEGENPNNYEIVDISLLLLAGTGIELVADAKSKLASSGVEDKASLQGKTISAISLNGKDSKVLLFFAGDAALIQMIEDGINRQLRECARWEKVSGTLEWEAPTLGVLPEALTQENKELFEQFDVKTKPDNVFTISGINDLIGDNLQLVFAEMWKKEIKGSLEFLLALPDMNDVARAEMEKLLLQRFGIRGKADEIYIVFFDKYIYTKGDPTVPYSISEGERRQTDGDNFYEKSEVYTIIRMDKLAIENFPSGDNGIAETLERLTRFSILDPYFQVGLYTWKGADAPATFSAENRLKDSAGNRIRFVDFYRAFKTVDMQRQAVDEVNKFFSAGRKQEHATRLKEMYALRLLREAANMDADAYALAAAVLDSESEDKTLHVETIDVYEYDILDAFIVYRETDRTVVLYLLPQKNYGNPAFLTFRNMQAFKEFIHSLTIHTESRNQLLARIKAEDRMDYKEFFTRNGFYERKGADYLLETMPGPIRRHHVSERNREWTYQTQIVRSTLAEVNQKSARSRDAKNNPFLKLADMFQRHVVSAVKISMFSHDEYEANVRTRIVSDTSLYLGILSLILFKIIPPWLGKAIGFSTAAPGLGVGVRQYLEQDRSADRLAGIELAINSGLDLMLGSFPMNRHRDEKKLVVSRKNYDDIVLKHGDDKAGAVMRAIDVDPDLTKPQGLHRITSDPAEHLLDIPAPLNQAARRGDRVVNDAVSDLRVRFELIKNSRELDSAGKRAKMLTILKAQNKEIQDKLYDMFVKIDLPEDAIGDADDLIKRILNEARDEEESSLMAFSKGNSDIDALQDAQIFAQQHVQALSDELRNPELFVGDRTAYLKNIREKDISIADVRNTGVDDVYAANGKLYVFIDDMAVRINTVQHILGSTIAVLPPGSIIMPRIQRIKGKWKLVEPKLAGGASSRHDVGLGASRLSSIRRDGKAIYQLQLPDAFRPADVVFDLTTCRWTEADEGGDIMHGGRTFSFFPATDSSPERWQAHDAASERPSPATTQMRADALEQFGFAREVPALPEYPEPQLYNAGELPKVIHKIWMGPGAIGGETVAKLRRTLFQANVSEHELRLHLDIPDTAAHGNTMKLLAPLIEDGLKVVDLRSEHFFEQFKKEKYFEQFEFYLEDDNLNYAGATSVLRYRLIYHEGGFYSGMDDVLKEPLDIDKIKHRDIVVLPPSAGSNFEYDNNFFGSAKGNPSLGNLSEESYGKFRQNRHALRQRPFYDRSKARDKQSERFYSYRQLRSETDGQALFSRMVSKHVRGRENYKKWTKILGGTGMVMSGDLKAAYLAAAKKFKSLDNVYEIGTGDALDQERQVATN